MIDPAGIPVISGDMDALDRHAGDLVAVGGDIADTGSRVHTTWQGLTPVYDAPEVGQLLLATVPVQQTSASMGEDVSAVGRALADYAAVAAFDDAQRRCANAIAARYGGTTYRADNGDGRLDPGEYGMSAEALDAAAREGGVPWGAQQAVPEEDDGNWLSALGHGALDVIGLVPVVGEVADGANALWYAAEGDYTNAALSAAAMIPVAGWAATGGKFAVKGYKFVHTLDGAKAFVRGRPPMVPKGATELPFTPNNKFSVGQRFEWTDPASGKKVRYHAHGADPAVPKTQNAGAGPVYRVRVGNHFLDAQGVKHTQNSVNPNSAAYNAQAANDTHIPYPKDLPSPADRHVRVPAVNPAAFIEPGGDGGSG
jgi:hypothetical protein